MNLKSTIWGPYFWFVIETIVYTYPKNPSEKVKKNFKKFIYALRYLLPCSICQKHFKSFIKKNPLDEYILDSKKKLMNWVILSHNNASKKNLTYDDVMFYYNSIYNDNKCNKT